jgi:flagellar biosynthesis regulator FlbT
MPEAAAATPASRLYYDLQTAYIGAAETRHEALDRARALIAGFQARLTSSAAQDICTRLLTLIEADSSFEALKLARQIIHYEADLLAPATA